MSVGRSLRRGSAQQPDLLHSDVRLPAVPAPQPALPSPAERRAIHYSGYDRAGRDFYATPDWVTEALLQHTRFRGPIWEPCCGDGAISTILAAHGYDVVSTDIADRGFGTSGVNFLTCDAVPPGCRCIVTNPPYGDTGSHTEQSRSPKAMLDFVRQALSLTASVQAQLALQVRLQWTAGHRAVHVDVGGAVRGRRGILKQRIRWSGSASGRCRAASPRLGGIRPRSPGMSSHQRCSTPELRSRTESGREAAFSVVGICIGAIDWGGKTRSALQTSLQ